MALNIKNREVEQLAAEVANLAGETKTEAIRQALRDRKLRLACRRQGRSRAERLRDVLETYIWPSIPAEVLGQPISKAEREQILGYGPDGV
jgi:antitoxin VapB